MSFEEWKSKEPLEDEYYSRADMYWYGEQAYLAATERAAGRIQELEQQLERLFTFLKVANMDEAVARYQTYAMNNSDLEQQLEDAEAALALQKELNVASLNTATGLEQEVKRLRSALETIKDITSNTDVYDIADKALKEVGDEH